MKKYIILAVILGGCANFGEALTPEEQDEREDRRLIQRDKLILFLNSCDLSPDHILIEYRKGSRSDLPNDRVRRRTKADIGVAFTHANVGQYARITNYSCATPQQVMDALRRSGL